MGERIENTEFYFVAFAHEPGGLLELLELHVSTDEMTVQKAISVYNKSLDTNFKEKRKGLRETLTKGDITQEQFDDKVKLWEQEKDDKKAELNQRKEAFDLRIARQRRLATEGIPDDTLIWLPMWQSFKDNPAALWQMLTRITPTPQVTDADNAMMVKQLIDSYRQSFVDDATLAYRTLIEHLFGGTRNLRQKNDAAVSEILYDPEDVILSLLSSEPFAPSVDLLAQWRAVVQPHEIPFLQQGAFPEAMSIPERVEQLKQLFLTYPDTFWTLVKKISTDGKPIKKQKKSKAQQAERASFMAFELRHAIEQRQMAELFAADHWWQDVKYTNRPYWTAKIAEWIEEMRGLGLTWRQVAMTPNFVHQPIKRNYTAYIEQLTREPLTEVPTIPVRTDAGADFSEHGTGWNRPQATGTANQRTATLEALLEKLGKRGGGKVSVEEVLQALFGEDRTQG